MTDTRYLFVDGAYLRRELEEISKIYFGGKQLLLDMKKITRNGSYRKTFYYDCLPPKKAGESPEDHKARCDGVQAIFDGMSESPGVHVFIGRVVGNEGRNRQKQVDVQIAVDMLSHTHRRNMSYATLLTGDDDFKPLVTSLVLDGMYVDLWCSKRSASKSLVRAADTKRDLDIDALGQMLSDDFLNEHPVPHRANQPRTHRTNQPLRVGRTAVDTTLRIYKRDDRSGYEIVTDAPNDRENIILHPDVAVLERYFKDKEGDVVWEK